MTENSPNENLPNEEIAAELEGQFVIRFPPEIATELKELIQLQASNFQKKLKIELDEDRRRGKVKFNDKILPAKIYDLPAIIESHKTFDKKMFYKVADICQIMICGEEQEPEEEDEKPYLFHEYLDKEGRDKRYLYPHGITPCLKNVRKNRFRKTRKNRCAETPFVQKEVLRLLKTDSEAIDYRFELIDPEDDTAKSSNDKSNLSKDKEERKTPGEFDIFGSILSSSDSSDEENTEKDTVSEINNLEIGGQLTGNDNYDNAILSDRNNSKDNDPNSPIETEAAGINLEELLKDEKDESEKNELHQMLQELKSEITKIRAQKELQQCELLEIGNAALRLRLEMNIEHLTAKEEEKQREYDEISNILN